MAVILASQSPRRKELMQLLETPFVVRVADVEETLEPGLSPAQQVAQISRRKAEAVSHTPQDVVIGADTVVVYGDAVLGKPVDEADAARMLTMLSGKTHRVMTGLTVLHRDQAISETVVTEVTFRGMSQKEIDHYIATKEPMDKAGSYGIQGGAARFVEQIRGDYYNVVGLPVCRLSQILCRLMEDKS